MKMMPVIAIVLILAIACYLFFTQRKKQVKKGFFIAPQGVSDERIKKLNLDSPSENASYILDTAKLSIPQEKIDFGNIEPKPNPNTKWIIDISRSNGGVFEKGPLWKIFDEDWRTKFTAAQIYGHSPTDGKWHYVIAGDSPETYDSIRAGINLLETYDDDKVDYNPKKLERYVEELKKRFATYPGNFVLHPAEDVTKAVEKAKKLVGLKKAFDNDLVIILKADSNYTGLRAWDALSSLGLKWGDGDLFHWNNSHDYGDQQFFTVWSTTHPGYFFPEDVKKGLFNPQDLLFGYSVPRSADPLNIFNRMVESVKYCQKRLGGEILNRQGLPFNEETERKALAQLVENMKLQGIQAGSLQALTMF